MPRKNRLYVYVNPSLIEKLTEMAKKYNLSVSSMAGMFIASGMRVFDQDNKSLAAEDQRRWEAALEEARKVAA